MTGGGVVRQLPIPGKPQGTQPPARRRILVPVNDNRPPLPVRLRRPIALVAGMLLALAAAFHWLM